MIRPVMLWVVLSFAMTSAQPSPRVAALVDAVKPALPFPGADASGAVPESGGEDPRWFVIWPAEPEETRIVVRANPLHPDTQKLVSTAEGAIQRAVAIAERKAQAAYDRALEEIKRTGKSTDFDGISLEDEGAAGQRLDAELELAIEVTAVSSYEVGTSVAPAVTDRSCRRDVADRGAAQHLSGQDRRRSPRPVCDLGSTTHLRRRPGARGQPDG